MLSKKFWATLGAAVFSGSAMATTFVYVSNAEDGDIGAYTLKPDGTHEGEDGAMHIPGEIVVPRAQGALRSDAVAIF